MKKLAIIFVVAVFISLDVIRTFAQTPQSFNYQAIARDISGNILANQNVSFKIIILKTSTTGTVVYSETHSIITNQFGLVNIQIGNGTVVSGDLSTIDWGTDIYFVRIEMDVAGGVNYQLMGTSQLLSVPYALYAQSAGGSIDYDTDSTNELQTLSVNGNNLTISKGNMVTLTDNVNDADADSTNELQALSISNDTIYLSNGGFVILPGGSVDADADSTNELQNITKTGNTITLSKGGGSVTDD
ncbi:MAG: hypothetical protein IIA88_06825, partial [Bacteroidetes bacterium]|nr:hypothetical protein [Bacteroidota bacterium]